MQSAEDIKYFLFFLKREKEIKTVHKYVHHHLVLTPFLSPKNNFISTAVLYSVRTIIKTTNNNGCRYLIQQQCMQSFFGFFSLKGSESTRVYTRFAIFSGILITFHRFSKFIIDMQIVKRKRLYLMNDCYLKILGSINLFKKNCSLT